MTDPRPMIESRISTIRDRLDRAARNAGRRPGDVRLVAVTKTVPIEGVVAAAAVGQRVFGENYLQEAREKIDAMGEPGIQWHFIGHLQRNKAKYAVRLFDLIHTLDSEKLARELDRQAAQIKKVQPVLIQVNCSGEATKSGIRPEAAAGLARAVGEMGHLSLQGLMTIPPSFDDPIRARPYVAMLRKLAAAIDALGLAGVSMTELSMGMSGDFETAIAEGATLVRIGTAIFGERR